MGCHVQNHTPFCRPSPGNNCHLDESWRGRSLGTIASAISWRAGSPGGCLRRELPTARHRPLSPCLGTGRSGTDRIVRGRLGQFSRPSLGQ